MVPRSCGMGGAVGQPRHRVLAGALLLWKLRLFLLGARKECVGPTLDRPPKGPGRRGLYAPTPAPHWLTVLLEDTPLLHHGLSHGPSTLWQPEMPWGEGPDTAGCMGIRAGAAGGCGGPWGAAGSGWYHTAGSTRALPLRASLPTDSSRFCGLPTQMPSTFPPGLAEFSAPFQEALAPLTPSTCFRRDTSKEPLLFLRIHHAPHERQSLAETRMKGSWGASLSCEGGLVWRLPAWPAHGSRCRSSS